MPAPSEEQKYLKKKNHSNSGLGNFLVGLAIAGSFVGGFYFSNKKPLQPITNYGNLVWVGDGATLNVGPDARVASPNYCCDPANKTSPTTSTKVIYKPVQPDTIENIVHDTTYVDIYPSDSCTNCVDITTDLWNDSELSNNN